MGGFFAGLLGGYGATIEKQRQDQFTAESEMRRGRMAGLVQQMQWAEASLGEHPNPDDTSAYPGGRNDPAFQRDNADYTRKYQRLQLQLQAIGQQMDQLSQPQSLGGGGGLGGAKQVARGAGRAAKGIGQSLETLLPFMGKVWHHGRQAGRAAGQPSAQGTPGPAPPLQRRPDTGLSAVPGAPGSGRTDPFGQAIAPLPYPSAAQRVLAPAGQPLTGLPGGTDDTGGATGGGGGPPAVNAQTGSPSASQAAGPVDTGAIAASNAQTPPAAQAPSASAPPTPAAGDQGVAADTGGYMDLPMPRTYGQAMTSPILPPWHPSLTQQARQKSRLQQESEQASFEQLVKQGRSLGLSGDSLANWVAGRNIEAGGGLQHVAVVLSNGRTAMANYDRVNGKWYDAATGQDISTQVTGEARPPASDEGRIAPEIEAQIGPQPSPQNYPGGKSDPKYLADLKSWGQAAEGIKNREAQAGRAVYAQSMLERYVQPYIDTKPGPTQGTAVSMNAADFNEANKKEPGRFVSAGVAVPAMAKGARFVDIQWNAQNVRQAANNLSAGDLSPSRRALMGWVLTQPDPGKFWDVWSQSTAAGWMTPAQKEYFGSLAYLTENAMYLSQASGGTSAEDVRNQIKTALPGLITSDKSLALRQLDLFDGMVARLAKGVPKLGSDPNAVGGVSPPPRPGAGGVTPPPQPSAGTQAAAGVTVRMRTPDGKTWDIPADKVKAAQARGAEIIQ